MSAQKSMLGHPSAGKSNSTASVGGMADQEAKVV
jgi:hypothetical protein